MTTSIAPSMPHQLLSTAAAVLLSHALSAIDSGATTLGVTDIYLPDRYALSQLGPGTRYISAGEAWAELAARRIITGTPDSWIPSTAIPEVAPL